MKKTFEIDDLLKIARRTNNQKRPYLYVNPLQGKHVPVSPSVTLALFRLLAEKVESRYKGEKLLVIGFAETATAIGFTIACRAENVTYAMCTTREEVEGAEYLFFTESHSHATEQRLVSNRLPEVLEQVDRVVFAEDEVTTGRTIEKLIRELQKRYPDRELKFGIVSILNSMTKERLAELENEGVVCDFLHRIPAGYRTEEINRFRYESAGAESVCEREAVFQELFLGDDWNGRLPADTKTIWDTCQRFAENAFRAVFPEEEGDPKPRQQGAAEGSGETREKKILVLGTEECMFPGLLFGAAIEEKCPGWRVRFHATTRSPIEVSEDPDYPLHTRWPLCSLYEAGRRTFVYNLEAYDRVFVVTDAAPVCREGQQNLAEALTSAGSTDITLIQWGGPGRE